MDLEYIVNAGVERAKDAVFYGCLGYLIVETWRTWRNRKKAREKAIQMDRKKLIYVKNIPRHVNEVEGREDEVREALYALSNLPDSLFKSLDSYGELIIVEGRPTKITKVENFPTGEWSGFYQMSPHPPLIPGIAVVAVDNERIRAVTLHEYGHMLDDLFHVCYLKISHTSEFKEMFNEYKGRMLDSHANKNEEEFFAESFAFYFNNSRTREWVKNKIPKVYDLMKRIEEFNLFDQLRKNEMGLIYDYNIEYFSFRKLMQPPKKQEITLICIENIEEFNAAASGSIGCI